MKKYIICSIFTLISLVAFPFFSQAQVADYQVLSDAPINVTAGTYKTYKIKLPVNFVKSDGRSRPILAFKVRRMSGTPILKIELNDGSQYSSAVPADGNLMNVYEVISGSNFDAAGENSIQFNITGGSIILADVVLWYQVQN